MFRPRRTPALALALAFTSALVACGDDDRSTTGSGGGSGGGTGGGTGGGGGTFDPDAGVLDPDAGTDPDPDAGTDPTPITDDDGDGVPSNLDCDDSVATGAACSAGCVTYYRDADDDGYGDALAPATTCTQPPGYVEDATDCDDDPSACGANCSPGNLGPDLCGDGDNNCDGTDGEHGFATFFRDDDGDGFGISGDTVDACEAPAGYGSNSGDCDPDDPDNWSDCIGCVDMDGDGAYVGCDAYVRRAGRDCDDDDILVRPGIADLPLDGEDSDCAGGDAALSDDVAVFVSATEGNDANDGTRLAPVATLAKGVALAEAAGKIVIVDGDFADLPLTTTVSLAGGYRFIAAESRWERDVDAYRSHLTCPVAGCLTLDLHAAPIAVDGFHVAAPDTFAQAGITMSAANRVGDPVITVTRTVIERASQGKGLVFPTEAVTAVVAESELHAPTGGPQGYAVQLLGSSADRRVLVHRTTIDGAWTYGLFAVGSGLVATNNVVDVSTYGVDIDSFGTFATGHFFANNILSAATAVRIQGPNTPTTVFLHNVIAGGSKGVHVRDSAHVVLINNLIDGGTGTSSASIVVDADIATLQLRRNGLYGPSQDCLVYDVAADTCITQHTVVNQCSWASCDAADTNFNLDPQFVDPANGDYRLLPTSPCLSGASTVMPWDPLGYTDIDHAGQPRPLGAGAEVGAFEIVDM